jgi:alkanesulfonate monooxygenase SsuD/methylene tetrahydromethanopterin reductase-like flavin-dependent oxidoreductase (luciferase family)
MFSATTSAWAASRRNVALPSGFFRSRTAYHSINIGPDREECLAEARRFFDQYYGEGVFGREAAQAMTATGTVEECADQLREVRDEGATHIALRLASWRQREQLDLLIGKVLPALLAE